MGLHYTRTFEDERLLVALNFSDEPTPVEFPTGKLDTGAPLERLLANYDAEDETTVTDLLSGALDPWEARIYRVA